MRVVVTGASGFLGWHAAVHLLAANADARHKGRPEPFSVIRLDRAGFSDPDTLADAVCGANAVLHFAGVNRGPAKLVEAENPEIAEKLAAAIAAGPSRPLVVYANSIRAGEDTPYGRSKQRAARILETATDKFTNLLLPHVFGEGARPAYNNVTATLIDALHAGRQPRIDPLGHVTLLHASSAVRAAIGAMQAGMTGRIAPGGCPIRVPDLWERLQGMHRIYARGAFPDLGRVLDLQLFNSYRAAWPKGVAIWPLDVRRDRRGALFEASKGGGGGQVFFSRTEPGAVRGNHFHLAKVERFVVLGGSGRILLRKALTGRAIEIDVDGTAPAAVDIPTLFTHALENIGPEPLLTLFWTDRIHDPAAPDTYHDPVTRDVPHEKTQGCHGARHASGNHPAFPCHGPA